MISGLFVGERAVNALLDLEVSNCILKESTGDLNSFLEVPASDAPGSLPHILPSSQRLREL